MTEDNKKFDTAKPVSRTMMIQETESELKMIVKKAHIEGHSRRQLSHDTYTAIYRLIRELDNEELARKCAIAFPRYVNKLNNEYSEVFRLLQTVSAIPRYASPDTEIVVQAQDGRIRTIPRMSDIPDYAFDRGVAAQKFGEDYIKEVRLRLRNVAALAAKEDYASNVSLRNVSEMQIRYEKHLDELDSLKGRGVKLVWISTHANCSARCAPYQGKLYSLDGTSGTTPDGVPYEPLEKATDVYYTTKAGVRYKNGLFGFNCRHEMSEYTPGSKPVTIPDAVVKRQREIEKTQREFERAIRYERTLYEVSKGLGHKETDRLAIQAWHRKVDLNKQYKEFCLKNNLAYPAERVQIFKDTELDIFKDKLLSKNKLTGREKTLVSHLTNEDISGKIQAARVVDDVEIGDPMPAEQFQRIQQNAEEKGLLIISDEESEHYVLSRGAEGITLNADTICLIKNPSRVAVFEELIHSTQYKHGKIDGSPISIAKAEIAAKEKLLKYAKAYKLTPFEIGATKKLLVSDRQTLQRLLEEHEHERNNQSGENQ